jgi:hypothetical protein
MLFNQVMRYVPTLNYLNRMKPTRILEVGSGSVGLAPYWPSPVVGCDVRFPEPPHPNLRGVVASTTALPFCNRAFECVCSLDTIEHLGSEQRMPALAEMSRVAARWVLVAYPAGRLAQWSDRAIQRFYDWRGGACPDWLGEHLRPGFPDGREVPDAARASEWRLTCVGNENVFAHFFFIVMETRAWFYLHAGDFLRKHARLIDLLSVPPCYRQIYFIDKRMS